MPDATLPMTSADNTAGQPQILTGPGMAYDLAPSQMQLFALTSDGVLHVSKSHHAHPYVLSFRARLNQLGVSYRVSEVAIEEIAALYNRAFGTQKQFSGFIDPEKLNLMQAVALDFIRQAVKRRASDIHILVNETYTLVKLRVDGDLLTVHRDSFEWGNTLCFAIYQGMTDVSAPHFTPSVPLDAQVRKKVKLPEEIVSVRVSTLPRDQHYAMFMRLFWREFSEAQSLEGLGYYPPQAEAIRLLARRPWGMILLTGPTGSGKTTSLYVTLTGLDRQYAGTRSIVTAEDPIELPIGDHIQTSVNTVSDEDREAAFLRFARASMRTDPDIFYLSEIRDVLSARLATQAAQTGHLVFTTTHSNNALETIPRLANMGIDTAEMLDHQVLIGIVAQRLIKKLCAHCKIDANQAREIFGSAATGRMLAYFGETVRFKGLGCPHCDGRGSKGRLVVAEVLPLDATLIHAMRQGNLALAETLWRRRGNMTMRDAAMHRVREGLIDPFMAEMEVNGYDEQLDLVNFAEIHQADEYMQSRRLSNESKKDG